MKNQIDLGNVQHSENEQITSMEQLAPDGDKHDLIVPSTLKETIPQALCLETQSMEECDYRFQEGGSAVNQNVEQPSSDGQVSQSKEPLI